MTLPRPSWTTRLAWAVLLLAAGVISIPWSGHVDDVDAQFYRVLTRHMVEDHTWFNLRFLPRLFPTFREHVPFGFWPWVVVDRAFGEGALGPLSGLFTLATLFLVVRLGRRLGGNALAVPAALVLVATDSFLLIGGRSRLDPLLYLFTTASMLPVLGDEAPTLRRWILGAAFAAAGALVKGPFGLLPYAAAVSSVALQQRSGRWLLAGAGLTLAAAAPVGAFLLWQRFRGDGTWWSLYVEAQLVASALGDRPTGHRPPWFPLQTLLTRFWPGLPVVFLGMWRIVRGQASRGERRVLIAAVLILLGLALPGRKVWNHTLVVYPLLALVAGSGVAPWVRSWVRARPDRAPRLTAILGGMAAVALMLSVLGIGRWFYRPCVVSTEFAPALARLSPGDRIAVLALLEPWGMISIVATETPYLPEPAFQPDWSEATGPRAMLVRDDTPLGPIPPPWKVVARARSWTLLER